MKTLAITCGLFIIAVLTCQALAQNEPATLPRPGLGFAGAKDLPKPKDKEKEKDKDKKLTEPPKTDIFAESSVMGPQYPTAYNPQMMGEKQIYFIRRFLSMPATTTTTVTPVIPSGPSTTTTDVGLAKRNVLVPAPHHGAFNVAENGSPMPQDRVFVFWSHYSGLGYGQSGQNAPVASTSVTTQTFGGNRIGQVSQTTTTTVIPGAQRVELDREVFGFEKTFLDGYASIELRAPLLHQGGGGAGFGVSAFGDLTIIAKYALYLDRERGNVISTGLGITVPTGPVINTTDGNFHDVLFQPYVGYLWNFNRCYVQGFSSLVVPTDKNDVTQLFNSVGFNYWLYRGDPDRLLTFVVPSVETHVTTPLNHRDLNGPIVVPDAVVMTTGVHLGLFRNATLTFGAATPLTGPRPFNVEAFGQFNLRY